MPVLHKKSCPMCGQSVNERKIQLTAEMVSMMLDVYKWCLENGKHEFERKEIKHLIKTETMTARFGDLVWFGGLMYKKEKGKWGMNMERTRGFFNKNFSIPTVVYLDPLTKEHEFAEEKWVHQVKGIKCFLDEHGEYIIEYRD